MSRRLRRDPLSSNVLIYRTFSGRRMDGEASARSLQSFA